MFRRLIVSRRSASGGTRVMISRSRDSGGTCLPAWAIVGHAAASAAGAPGYCPAARPITNRIPSTV